MISFPFLRFLKEHVNSLFIVFGNNISFGCRFLVAVYNAFFLYEFCPAQFHLIMKV